MNKIELQKKLQEYDNTTKSAGIVFVNTTAEEIELSSSVSEKAQQTIELIQENQGFKNLNAQFSAFFHKRGFPELVSIKSKDESRFIKFYDNDHILYSIIDKEDINYIKVKAQLNKVCE